MGRSEGLVAHCEVMECAFVEKKDVIAEDIVRADRLDVLALERGDVGRGSVQVGFLVPKVIENTFITPFVFLEDLCDALCLEIFNLHVIDDEKFVCLSPGRQDGSHRHLLQLCVELCCIESADRECHVILHQTKRERRKNALKSNDRGIGPCARPPPRKIGAPRDP